MRNKIIVSVLVTFVAISIAYGQGKITGKLVVGATTISQGDIKLSEALTTRDGKKLNPGLYRISVALTSRNEAQFVFSPYELDQPSQVKEGLTGNALNAQRDAAPIKIYVGASVTKNSFVKGVASNIEGTFRLESVTPSETMLMFESKQFGATATLGRPLDSKSVDLTPSFVSFEQPASCGNNCTEGFVKVTIKNEGNMDAKGKWNVVLVEPRLYVGTISDLPAGGEVTVTSTTKLKAACCNPLLAEAEVRPDFYNKDASDSNDGNNVRKFTINLQP